MEYNQYKEKIMEIVYKKNLSSIMNNTKWQELQSEVEKLPFPPPYIIKYITDEENTENFTNDVKYLGDWSDEPLKPFFRIEWIKVKPRYLKYQGRLVKDIVIDCSSEFLEILKKKSIPYEEKNGNYIIFGYK